MSTLRSAAKWVVNRTLLPTAQYIVKNIEWPDRATLPALANTAPEVVLPSEIAVTVKNLGAEYQGQRWRYPNMIKRVMDQEVEGCVQLIRDNLGSSYLAPTDIAIREYCIDRIPQRGLVLEFGVFQATSINHIADRLSLRSDSRIVHGFDSFEGLPSDSAGWVWHKGRFNLDGNMPPVRENVRLYKGWIDQTLPDFLSDHPNETIAFVHVDVDIYEPAKVVLEKCKPRLQPGSIILFDELIGYAGWRFHEFKALNEVFEPHEYEFIAFSDIYQAAIRIK